MLTVEHPVSNRIFWGRCVERYRAVICSAFGWLAVFFCNTHTHTHLWIDIPHKQILSAMYVYVDVEIHTPEGQVDTRGPMFQDWAIYAHMLISKA